MARPYFVLNKDGEDQDKDTFTLESLWENATNIQEIFEDEKKINEPEQLARSQLKRMLHAISTGDPNKSKEKYKQLPEKIREQLEGLFGINGENLWRDKEENRYLTQYKDFIELLELHYLGRQKKTGGVNRQEQERNDHE